MQRGEFDQQALFNKVHIIDNTITTKAFEKTNEIKRQMSATKQPAISKTGEV
jgi:hypothetical protein